MNRWQSQFLGRTELPSDLTDFEIAHYFTFDKAEHRAIKTRHGEHHRLAFAVHLGSMKMTGAVLRRLQAIPHRLLVHLSGELGISTPDVASLKGLSRRRQNLSEHQSYAAKVLGFSIFTDHRQRALVRHLRTWTETSDRSELAARAREWLYEQKILIPGDRRVMDAVRAALADAERTVLEAIDGAIPEVVRREWHRAVFAAHPPYRTVLGWLQRPPKRRSLKTLGEISAKVTFLKELGVDQYPLEAVPLPRLLAYAHRARKRKPAELRRLKPGRRTVELVCFLRAALMESTDVVAALAQIRTNRVFRRAADSVRADDDRMLTVVRARLEEIRQLVEDDSISAADLRERIVSLLTPDLKRRSCAARIREHLSLDARQTRPLLKHLIKLNLRHGRADHAHPQLAVLEELYARGVTELPADADISFDPRWTEVLKSPDRRCAMRAFEAATLQAVKRGLRNGSVWTEHSLDHRNRDQVFIESGEWKLTRANHYRRLGVRRRATGHYRPLTATLDVGLAALAEAVRNDTVVVEDRGVHLKAWQREAQPPHLDAARISVFDTVGPVQLPELLVELDSQVRFSWHLLGGRPPRHANELLALYGGLLAHGTELEASGIARMTPGLTANAVSSAMRVLENKPALRKANESVVEFMRMHQITGLWGDGRTVSADAISLEASRHLWNARVDPKRRHFAVAHYAHVLDQWGIIYDQPLVLGERQVGAAIEGVVGHHTSARINRLAVDTHGYTDFGMAISKLLGFDLCPRLRNLKHRLLHVPAGTTIPSALTDVVIPDISLGELRGGWDGLVRVAASIASGQVSATLALARYGSASRGDPVHKAGTMLGRMYRSLFLCDYFTNEGFRRELLRILNYGEALHALERCIHAGPLGAKRGRNRHELQAISGSLALLTNAVMAWMTSKMQHVVDTRGRELGLSDDIIRHLSPAHFRNVNLRGVFLFPIEEYSNRLLNPKAASA